MDKQLSSYLTVVVPVTQMYGKLQNLKTWIPLAIQHRISVRLIHDFRDSQTSTELQDLVESLNSEFLSLQEATLGSPGAARNLGMLNIKSHWVAFWDSDDIPDIPQFLGMLNRNPKSDISIGGYVEHDVLSNQRLAVQISSNYLESQLIRRLGIWRMGFKAEILEGKYFPTTSMGEDQIFLAEIGLAGLEISLYPHPVYEYKTNQPGALTSNKKAKSDLVLSIKYLIALLGSKDDLNFQFRARMFWSLIISMLISNSRNVNYAISIFISCRRELNVKIRTRLLLQLPAAIYIKAVAKREIK